MMMMWEQKKKKKGGRGSIVLVLRSQFVKMLIKYIVPEDGDDQAHPNVFKITAPQAPTLGQLKKAFPLPGKYHFRCLRSINNMTVWMDTTDDNAVLVTFEGAIFLKASRIGESNMRQQQPSSSSIPTTTAVADNRRGSLGERLLQFSGDENDHGIATLSTYFNCSCTFTRIPSFRVFTCSYFPVSYLFSFS